MTKKKNEGKKQIVRAFFCFSSYFLVLLNGKRIRKTTKPFKDTQTLKTARDVFALLFSVLTLRQAKTSIRWSLDQKRPTMLSSSLNNNIKMKEG